MKKPDMKDKFNLSPLSPDPDKKTSLFDESFFDEDDDEDFPFEESEMLSEDFNELKVPLQKENKLEIDNPTEHSSDNIPTQANDQPEAGTIAPKNTQAPYSSESERTIAQEIQFRLGCELGEVLIPYENLNNLNIGSVIDFKNTLQSLYLSINNVRVGEGMLVDIDGKIGIKITRWYGQV